MSLTWFGPTGTTVCFAAFIVFRNAQINLGNYINK